MNRRKSRLKIVLYSLLLIICLTGNQIVDATTATKADETRFHAVSNIIDVHKQMPLQQTISPQAAQGIIMSTSGDLKKPSRWSRVGGVVKTSALIIGSIVLIRAALVLVGVGIGSGMMLVHQNR